MTATSQPPGAQPATTGQSREEVVATANRVLADLQAPQKEETERNRAVGDHVTKLFGLFFGIPWGLVFRDLAIMGQPNASLTPPQWGQWQWLCLPVVLLTNVLWTTVFVMLYTLWLWETHYMRHIPGSSLDLCAMVSQTGTVRLVVVSSLAYVMLLHGLGIYHPIAYYCCVLLAAWLVATYVAQYIIAGVETSRKQRETLTP